MEIKEKFLIVRETSSRIDEVVETNNPTWYLSGEQKLDGALPHDHIVIFTDKIIEATKFDSYPIAQNIIKYLIDQYVPLRVHMFSIKKVFVNE